MNTSEFLMVTAAVVPDRPAIVFEDATETYEALQARSSKLANALTDMGIQKGDKVAMMEVNSPNLIETYFACAKIGAIFVPLNFRARPEEVAYMLQDSEAVAVVAGERYIPLVDQIRGEAPGVRHFVSLGAAPEGWSSFADILAAGADEDPFTEIDDPDLTILMFTAGTTGRPKGVMLAHKNFSEYVLKTSRPSTSRRRRRTFSPCPCTTSPASRR